MPEKTVSWNLVLVVAVTAIVSGFVGWIVTRTLATYEAGEAAAIGSAPAVVAIQEEQSVAADERAEIKESLARIEGTLTAAVENQNRILDALLNQ